MPRTHARPVRNRPPGRAGPGLARRAAVPGRGGRRRAGRHHRGRARGTEPRTRGQQAQSQQTRGRLAAADGRVSVVIESVSPQWATPNHSVTVTGIVRNGTAAAQQGLTVQLRSSATPLGNRDDLGLYAAGAYPADYPVGTPVPLPADYRAGRPGALDRHAAAIRHRHEPVRGLPAGRPGPTIVGVRSRHPADVPSVLAWCRRLAGHSPAQRRLDLAAHRPAVSGRLPGAARQRPRRQRDRGGPSGQPARRGPHLLGRGAPDLGDRPRAGAERDGDDAPVPGRRRRSVRRRESGTGQPRGPYLAEPAAGCHVRAAGLPHPVRGRQRRRAEPRRPRR